MNRVGPGSPYVDFSFRGLSRKHWREDAACSGQPLDNYTLRHQETKKKFFERVNLAEACPASCPVRAECARDAMIVTAPGTLRAGMMREDRPGSDLSYEQDVYLYRMSRHLMYPSEQKILDKFFGVEDV